MEKLEHLSMVEALPELKSRIERLLCAGEASSYGPYVSLGGGEVLVPGVAYSFRARKPLPASATRAVGQPVQIHVFWGLGGIGAELWEQEVRALLKLTAAEHPSLPRILEGAHVRGEMLAFSVTESAADGWLRPEAVEYVRRPGSEERLLRQVASLADALAVMHGHGLQHRTIGPHAIEVVADEAAPDQFRLRLARFELSSLLTHALRTSPEPRSDFFRNERTSKALEMACVAPECLGLWFPGSSAQRMEYHTSDVYGLGVLAAHLFLGALPPMDGVFTAEGIRAGRDGEWRRSLLQQIERCDLPKQLTAILEGMLRTGPRERSTAAEVADEFTRSFDKIARRWRTAEAGRTFLLGFTPLESRKTFLEWKWIDADPCSDEGKEELTAFLEGDLREGTLSYSPQGLSPFVAPQTEDERQSFGKARWVLLGAQGAYFCAPYYYRDQVWGPQVDAPEILSLRYVRSRASVWPLDLGPVKPRALPTIAVVPLDQGTIDIDALRQDHSSWTPLLRDVETPTSVDEEAEAFDAAVDFLLELEDVRLRAREYAFTIEPGSVEGDFLRLRWDEKREREYRHKHGTPLLTLFSANNQRRPRFGDFFMKATENGDVVWCPDADGRPDRRPARRGKGRVQEREHGDPSLLVIRREPGEHVPSSGWLRPAEDLAGESALRRMQDARLELVRLPGLMRQLRRPRVQVRLLGRWADVGEGLLGRGPEAVTNMLACRPLFALHGPPGTGKTTVATHAIRAAIEEDKSVRILVTAQSHFALDNLAKGITDALEGHLNVVSVRVVSPAATLKVKKEIRRFLPERLTEDQMRRIEARVASLLSNPRTGQEVKDIVKEWASASVDCAAEIQRRLRLGANLVFATCLTSTPRYLGPTREFTEFDWIVVEEAAKAWPIELFVPLVRGTRWTLIGDHRQLPAFGMDDVKSLLRDCAQSRHAELRRHGEQSQAYVRTFDLFREMFEPSVKRAPKPGVAADQKPPVLGLNDQFRMHRTIGDTVSRAFYEGGINTPPTVDRPSGLIEPEWLRRASLVWVDTAGVPECADEPQWYNDGEAELVVDILRRLQPTPVQGARVGKGRLSETPLAVLSPYNMQVDRICQKIAADGRLGKAEELVHTIDSFQGREADYVVVSLVRHRNRDTVIGSFGHTLDRQRINVMISRAMRLLVLVGNRVHFRDRSQTDFWADIERSVREGGKVIDAARLLRQRQLSLGGSYTR